jgi:hypothetical protein
MCSIGGRLMANFWLVPVKMLCREEFFIMLLNNVSHMDYLFLVKSAINVIG